MVSRLSELIGQAPVAERLARMVAARRVPHALLFTGPPSVGKHTAARLFAQALLCPNAAGADPCGLCSSCVSIQNGALRADLRELSAEEPKLKIDAVREAVRALQSGSVGGGRKLLIIPDAERMNVAAQNALLKTLEEPPGEAVLILSSARPQLLLTTVRSRCQQLRFSPVPISEVAAELSRRRGMSAGEAQLAATLTGGAFGPALSLEMEPLLAARAQIEAWDRRLSPPAGADTPAEAIAVAAELSEDRSQMLGQLQIWQSWLRDQIILAAGAEVPLGHADRQEALADGAARGLSELVRRSEALAEAIRSLELPFNYQARLIADNLCLRLAAL